MELQNYNIEIRHKPREQNKADTLSRRPDYEKDNPNNEHLIVLPRDRFYNLQTVEVNAAVDPGPEEDLDEKVKLSQEDNYDTLKEWLAPHGLTIDKDNYFWRNTALVVVGDDSLRRGVIHTFHDLKTSGHPGISNTLSLVQQHYWWPHMKDFVTNYVKGCAKC